MAADKKEEKKGISTSDVRKAEASLAAEPTPAFAKPPLATPVVEEAKAKAESDVKKDTWSKRIIRTTGDAVSVLAKFLNRTSYVTKEAAKQGLSALGLFSFLAARIGGHYANQQKIDERTAKQTDSSKLEKELKQSANMHIEVIAKLTPPPPDHWFTNLGLEDSWKDVMNIPFLVTFLSQLSSSIIEFSYINKKDAHLDDGDYWVVISLLGAFIGFAGPNLIQHFENRNHARMSAAVDERATTLKILLGLSQGGVDFSKYDLSEMKRQLKNVEIKVTPAASYSAKTVAKATLSSSPLGDRDEKAIVSRILPGMQLIDTPPDHSCLFWSAALGLLLPVLDDPVAFEATYDKLFGKGQLDIRDHGSINISDLRDSIRAILCTYDCKRETPIEYEKNILSILICKVFRNRVVDELSRVFADGATKEPIIVAAKTDNSTIDSWQKYTINMRATTTWGGDAEIRAISSLMKVKIIIHSGEATHFVGVGYGTEPLHLAHINASGKIGGIKNHYGFCLPEAVYSKQMQRPILKTTVDGIGLGSSVAFKEEKKEGTGEKAEQRKLPVVSVSSTAGWMAPPTAPSSTPAPTDTVNFYFD